MIPANRKRFITPCDLSRVSLAEAINAIGMTRAYTLHVSLSEFPSACMLVRDHFTSSLPIQLNVCIEEVASSEWYVSNGAEAFGSEGA